MQSKQQQNTGVFRGNCIGCTDCKGLCRELMDLAFVPETVLKEAVASR